MRNGQSFLRIWLIAAALLLGLAASCAAQGPPMGITPQQKDQLKKLAAGTRDKTDKVRDALRQARHELLNVYLNYDLNERKAKAALLKINKSQMALLNIHLDNQIGLRQVLSQDQFEKFAKMVMRRPGRGGPGFSRMGEDIFPSDILSRRSLDELGASDDQQKRAAAMSAKIRDRNKVIGQLRHDTERLLDMYSQYNLDSAAAKQLIEEIHRNQIALSEMNHRKQQILRSVLNENQFEQMKTKLAQRMDKMREDEQKRRNRD